MDPCYRLLVHMIHETKLKMLDINGERAGLAISFKIFTLNNQVKGLQTAGCAHFAQS